MELICKDVVPRKKLNVQETAFITQGWSETGIHSTDGSSSALAAAAPHHQAVKPMGGQPVIRQQTGAENNRGTFYNNGTEARLGQKKEKTKDEEAQTQKKKKDPESIENKTKEMMICI